MKESFYEFESSLTYLNVVSDIKSDCQEFTARAPLASKYYLSVESKTPSQSVPARSVTPSELRTMFWGCAITMFGNTAMFGDPLIATRPISLISKRVIAPDQVAGVELHVRESFTGSRARHKSAYSSGTED